MGHKKGIILVMCVAIFGASLFLVLKPSKDNDVDKKNTVEQVIKQETWESVIKKEEKPVAITENKVKETIEVQPQITEADIFEQENTKTLNNATEIRNVQNDKQIESKAQVSAPSEESLEEFDQRISDNNNEKVTNPLTLDTEEYQDIYSEEVIPFMRSDDQNEVTVDVVFNNPFKVNEQTKEHLVFEVLLNTHSFDIDESNLDKKITLKNDQGVIDVKGVAWISDGPTTGHHVSGKLLIPKQVDSQNIIFQGIKFLELTMKDVAGVEQRLFRWDNEDIAFEKIN
jgi:hypothetical protein